MKAGRGVGRRGNPKTRGPNEHESVRWALDASLQGD